jgi:hypothetical protein
MKRCSYCGRENDEALQHCRECGTAMSAELPQSEPEAEWEPLPESFQTDLGAVQDAFEVHDGFSRPKWKCIYDVVSHAENDLSLRERWEEVVLQWLARVRRELGGRYHVTRNKHFACLTALPAAQARDFMGFAGTGHVEISERLAGLAWRDTPGPHVVLLFEEEDDYFEYVGYFEHGEVLPDSLGMHFGQGYPHTAIRSAGARQDGLTLIHELTHHCLTHLPIPLWLNEGVAQRLQRGIAGVYVPRTGQGPAQTYWADVSGWAPPLMWDELAERHHAFWTEESIQGFWAGTTFHEGGDRSQLSYSLAEVIVHLLSDDRESFLHFLSRAHYDDAGQTAAFECFGASLGEIAATFLGEGNWRPVRKAMVDLWAKYQRDETTGG